MPKLIFYLVDCFVHFYSVFYWRINVVYKVFALWHSNASVVLRESMFRAELLMAIWASEK
jgi:hypothetical protein